MVTRVKSYASRVRVRTRPVKRLLHDGNQQVIEANTEIMDALLGLRKMNGAATEEPSLSLILSGMIYANDAAIVQQLINQPWKIMPTI